MKKHSLALWAFFFAVGINLAARADPTPIGENIFEPPDRGITARVDEPETIGENTNDSDDADRADEAKTLGESTDPGEDTRRTHELEPSSR
jgi:hypothetical protein